MPLVRCPRCKFSFEAPEPKGVTLCNQCGGPTVDAAGDDLDAPPHERRKTRKIPIIKPAAK
jgi:hypothetical protein